MPKASPDEVSTEGPKNTAYFKVLDLNDIHEHQTMAMTLLTFDFSSFIMA